MDCSAQASPVTCPPELTRARSPAVCDMAEARAQFCVGSESQHRKKVGAVMASRKAHSVTYSVIDTETTGLSAEKNRIIEIAVVTVREFRIVDQFVTTIALPEGTSIGAEHIPGFLVKC
jgi:DNA polymerase III epsilon subunit-like protein